VHLYKNKTAKSLRIILRPGKPPRVTVPSRVSFKAAEDFLYSKKLWLKENLEKIKQLENKTPVFTENTEFKTCYHTLNIKRHDKDSCKYKLKEGVLEFYCPASCNIENTLIQQEISKAITETLRFEAKGYIPERVKALSEKHNLRYSKVFIKNLKSRWGSCSARHRDS